MYKYPSNTKFNFTVFHIAITFVIASIVYLTGGSNNNASYAIDLISTNNTEDKVFDIPSSSFSSELITTDHNISRHEIEMQVQILPDGQPAYKMLKHIIKNSYSENDITYRYSNQATIPGPTIIVTEDEEVDIKIIDTNRSVIREHFIASIPGTFSYDDKKLGEIGLFGAVIVNPKNSGILQSLINGSISNNPLDQIDKDIVLYMVGSTFWGMEISKSGMQTPLWTNPTVAAKENQKVRFHVLGLSPIDNPEGHQHTFHLHAHRWVDPGTSHIIDAKTINPRTSHVFVVDAGDHVGPGDWQYHCHVFAHMEAGMMGTFRVSTIANSSNTNINSISGPSPYKNFATFEISDEPGKWFKNTKGDITHTGTESVAILNKSGTVHFMMSDTNGEHTVTSMIFPKNAKNMPFDQLTSFDGGGIVKLIDPGLYLFTCKIHHYMFAAVIVDDPSTTGLDLGEEITLINGVTIPTSSDLATRLLRLFFISTAPNNWQNYLSLTPWHISYPNVDVRISNGTILNLKEILEKKYGQNITLSPLQNPSTSGVGEVWIDTQFEKTASKTKPGTATAINTTTWQITKKVALPEINMNNPHNMWADKDQNLIYQTQWFDNKTTIFNRTSGQLVKNIIVGDDPSHVMTRPNTDQLYVALNGEHGVLELSQRGESLERIIPMQLPGQNLSHPHGHWLSHDGKFLITPNALSETSTIYNLEDNEIKGHVPIGHSPIATGMMPNSSKYYMTDFHDSTMNVIDTNNGRVIKRISLIKDYDPISGAISGPIGAFPIQTPVSPDGKYMVTANTLSATITIIDTESDEIVKMLPCDPGCHGVNFGAKAGGGYYAYVSSTFSNELIVVDGDPNNDGDSSDAEIVGRVSLVSSNTQTDDKIVGLEGTGGQGVLAIPNVYNGWVQNVPSIWKDILTEEQQNPK